MIKKGSVMSLSGKQLMNTAALFALLVFSMNQCWAQEPAASSAAGVSASVSENSSSNQPQAAAGDVRYRIGPGDILEVRVARAPELSRESVRVDQSGMIRMPMLDVDIPAACLTEAELAESVARFYRKYKNNPHVDVFVREFQSQPVAVLGAVKSPAQFKLQRRVRLLELLTFAGGQAPNAGQTIQVVHAGGPSTCEKETESDPISSAMASYNLTDTLRGVPEANPFVQPGDVVQVPEADQVFVLGNVLKPSAIPLREPLSVSRAIAIAGGTAPSTKRDKVRIIRQLPGQTAKQSIAVDLSAIEKNRAEDVMLQANDIVDVPISGTKSFLRSLVGAVVPTMGQLPVRVIP